MKIIMCPGKLMFYIRFLSSQKTALSERRAEPAALQVSYKRESIDMSLFPYLMKKVLYL